MATKSQNTSEETTKQVIDASGEVVASAKDVSAAPAKTAAATTKKYAVADHRTIIGPVVTEKSLLAQGKNKVIFEVAMDANKISIKKSFFNLFGIMPEKVNVMIREGKKVRYGRSTGVRKDTKKAVITLKAGQSI